MNPIEEYFFDNQIEVWTQRNATEVVYYNTSNGEYIADEQMRLFKIIKNKKEYVQLGKYVI